MDSREILNGITEVTLPTGMDKVDLKDRDTIRSDFYYAEDKNFDEPLLVRGTNKQLLPFENLVSFDADRRCSVDEFVKMCGNVDDNLRIHTVDNISRLDMVFIKDSHIVMHDPDFSNGQGRYFVIITDTKELTGETVAFRSWSEVLKIPYTYSKKSPGFLNETNFKYWQACLTAALDQQIPVDLIYMEEPIAIDVGDDEPEILAYVLVNILKADTVCEKRGVISEVFHPDINSRVPKISNIVRNIQQQIIDFNPNISTTVQQYSLGYTGTNKGRHYVRLVLEETGFDFDIDGNIMHPAIVIESDFIGKCKDFSNVTITFSLFKEICSNGLSISWTESQKQALQETFVLNYCRNRGISKEDIYYAETVEEANSKFNTVFSSNGLTLSVSMANSVLSKSLFGNILEFFLNSTHILKSSLEGLKDAEFTDIEEREFVTTVHNLASSMNISSEITKIFLIEYIAGNMVQDQMFRTPLEVVDFLTYICRSFDSTIQLDIERKAYAFACSLMQVLIYKHQSENFVYEKYRRRINQDNI